MNTTLMIIGTIVSLSFLITIVFVITFIFRLCRKNKQPIQKVEPQKDQIEPTFE